MACLWPIRSSMYIRKVEGVGRQLQNTEIQWTFFSRLLAPTLGELGRQRLAMRENRAEPWPQRPLGLQRRGGKLQKFPNIHHAQTAENYLVPHEAGEHVPDDVTLTVSRGFRGQTRDVARRRQ